MSLGQPLFRSIALVLAIAAFSVSCSSSFGTDPSGSQPSSSGGAGSGVLDFTAPKLGGGTVEGASYAGQDVAIWFWAPW